MSMTKIRNTVAALAVAGASLATVPMMTGCAAEGAYIIEESPPPPREEVVVYRPGYVWIHGRWAHPGRRWIWQGGYYERERPNQVYVEGRWERRNHGHVWVNGTWRTRGRVVIR